MVMVRRHIMVGVHGGGRRRGGVGRGRHEAEDGVEGQGADERQAVDISEMYFA